MDVRCFFSMFLGFLNRRCGCCGQLQDVAGLSNIFFFGGWCLTSQQRAAAYLLTKQAFSGVFHCFMVAYGRRYIYI